MDHSHAFSCYNEILMFTFQSITRILTFLPCTETPNPVEYKRKRGSAYREFEKQSCHFTLAAWCQMLSQHVQPRQVWLKLTVATLAGGCTTWYFLSWLKCDWSWLITDDIIIVWCYNEHNDADTVYTQFHTMLLPCHMFFPRHPCC